MDSFSMWFSNASDPFLSRCEYVHHATQTKVVAVRGKSASAFGNAGSFQWTSAVQAMVAVMIQTARSHICTNANYEDVILSGERGSLAASLDYCLSKTPLWIVDMFGTDSKGMARARRLFKRSNPERKRGGEVSIAINQSLLPSKNIRLFLDRRELTVDSELGSLQQRLLKSSPHVLRKISDVRLSLIQTVEAAHEPVLRI